MADKWKKRLQKLLVSPFVFVGVVLAIWMIYITMALFVRSPEHAIFVILALVFMGGIFYYSTSFNYYDRREALAELADQWQGEYWEAPPSWIWDKLEEIDFFALWSLGGEQEARGLIENVLSGREKGRKILLFDYYFTALDSRTVCLIEGEHDLEHLRIEPAHPDQIRPWEREEKWQKLEGQSSSFSRLFWMASREGSGQSELGKEVEKLFVQKGRQYLSEIHPHWVVVTPSYPVRLSPGEISSMVAFGLEVAEAFSSEE